MSAKKTNKGSPERESASAQDAAQTAQEIAAQEAAAREQEAAQAAGDGAQDTAQDGAEAAPDATQALQGRLDEANDKLMRTLAEYDNYRKRSQREKTEIYPDAVAATVTKLLPVLDNFERALGADCADADFKKGVEMIFTHFRETLATLGVEEIAAQDAPFDPNLHNAVMHVEDDALGDNVVSQVMQKGYRLGDRILRHAMVQVAN